MFTRCSTLPLFSSLLFSSLCLFLALPLGLCSACPSWLYSVHLVATQSTLWRQSQPCGDTVHSWRHVHLVETQSILWRHSPLVETQLTLWRHSHPCGDTSTLWRHSPPCGDTVHLVLLTGDVPRHPHLVGEGLVQVAGVVHPVAVLTQLLPHQCRAPSLGVL